MQFAFRPSVDSGVNINVVLKAIADVAVGCWLLLIHALLEPVFGKSTRKMEKTRGHSRPPIHINKICACIIEVIFVLPTY